MFTCIYIYILSVWVTIHFDATCNEYFSLSCYMLLGQWLAKSALLENSRLRSLHSDKGGCGHLLPTRAQHMQNIYVCVHIYIIYFIYIYAHVNVYTYSDSE